MEKKKSTRLELNIWKKLKNLATEKESNIEKELEKILKKELGIKDTTEEIGVETTSD